MKNNDGEGINGYIGGEDIGISWLNKITSFETASARQMPTHSHRFDELILFIRGEFKYLIDGMGESAMAAGFGILIPANAKHALVHDIDSPGERICFLLKRRMSKSGDCAIFSQSDYQSLHSRLRAIAGRPFLIPKSEMEHIRLLSKMSRQNCNFESGYNRAMARMLTCNIFFAIATGFMTAEHAPRLIESAAEYLDEHMSEEIEIDKIVNYIGYGRSRLFTLFHERYGMSPMQFLTRIRMERAQEMLSSTDLPVKEIAKRVGINNIVYFSTLFRHNCAMTPLEWRHKSPNGTTANHRTE